MAVNTQGLTKGLAGEKDRDQNDKRRMSFDDVLTDVDIDYYVFGGDLKEIINVKRRPTSGSIGPFRFDLALAGVTAEEIAGGGIAFRDAANTVVAEMPRGVASDHTVPGDDHGHETSVVPRLVGTARRPAVELEIDKAWLDDPNRRFPLQIDPALKRNLGVGTGGFDAYTSADAPNQAFPSQLEWGAWVNHIGVDSAPGNVHEHYAYLYYGIPADIYFKQILSATWKGYFFHSPQWPNEFAMWAMAESWDTNITWNTRKNHRTGDDALILGATPGDALVERNVITWMQRWASGQWTNYGISMDTRGLPSTSI